MQNVQNILQRESEQHFKQLQREVQANFMDMSEKLLKIDEKLSEIKALGSETLYYISRVQNVSVWQHSMRGKSIL